MTRISKDPEIRKNELIDAAEALFITEGYDNTSVSAIVKRINVAQGTFYYYFSSKEEVLRAVIDRIFDSAVTEISSVIEDNKTDAVAKLAHLLRIIFELKDSREDFFQYIHEDRNALLHQKLASKLMEILTPMLATVINQGLREKLFTVQHPSETADLIMVIIGHLYDLPHGDNDVSDTMVKAVSIMLEKTLGIREKTLRLKI